MPVDSRRIPVPDVSHSPDLFASSGVTATLINDEGLRLDGRSSDDVGSVFFQCGTISQAKGSCFCELHKTKVICSVYGPKDIEQKEDFQMMGRLKCEFKFAPFSCRKRRGHIPDIEETELCEVLMQALSPSVCLHRYPKSQIDVFVMVLQDNGSAIAAGITAASLALSDACIEQYDIVTSAAVRVCGKESFLLDPISEEEYDQQKVTTKKDLNNGLVTVALLPSLNQVSGVLSVGSMECGILQEAIELATVAAQNLYVHARKCLIDKVSNDKHHKNNGENALVSH